MLTLANLQHQWKNGDQHVPGLIEGIAASAETLFPKYGFVNQTLIAHFMAQVSEECAAGLEMQENMNYTAPRLLEVFPTHFTPSLAAKAAHNPQMIAEIAYGGRMGNRPPPSTDGWIYRGQGLTQCTGRGVHAAPEPSEGYAALQLWLNKEGVDLDLMSSPQLIFDPKYALLCGIGDFLLCGCMPFAEKDDVVGVTRKLNGGLNGLADRESWLARWKLELS
jgi:putative chitinase